MPKNTPRRSHRHEPVEQVVVGLVKRMMRGVDPRVVEHHIQPPRTCRPPPRTFPVRRELARRRRGQGSPSLPISAAADSSCPLTSAHTTMAPSSANSSAEARPMPDPAPVTTATLPVSFPKTPPLRLTISQHSHLDSIALAEVNTFLRQPVSKILLALQAVRKDAIERAARIPSRGRPLTGTRRRDAAAAALRHPQSTRKAGEPLKERLRPPTSSASSPGIPTWPAAFIFLPSTTTCSAQPLSARDRELATIRIAQAAARRVRLGPARSHGQEDRLAGGGNRRDHGGSGLSGVGTARRGPAPGGGRDRGRPPRQRRGPGSQLCRASRPQAADGPGVHRRVLRPAGDGGI